MDELSTAALVQVGSVISIGVNELDIDVVPKLVSDRAHGKGTDAIGAVEDELALIRALGSSDELHELDKSISEVID